jgi:hypothetical protein
MSHLAKAKALHSGPLLRPRCALHRAEPLRLCARQSQRPRCLLLFAGLHIAQTHACACCILKFAISSRPTLLRLQGERNCAFTVWSGCISLRLESCYNMPMQSCSVPCQARSTFKAAVPVPALTHV